jgi:hypothetical protein
VALDSAGNVYVADVGLGTVVRLAPDGSQDTLMDGLDTVRTVAVDGAGNVYTADEVFGIVYQIPAGGGSPIAQVPTFTMAHGVAVDAAGMVYVSNGSSPAKFAPGGSEAVTLGFTGLGRAIGVAVDPAGTVFVADYNNEHIVSLTTTGVQTTLGFTEIDRPAGVAVDAAGNVYTSLRNPGRVVKLTPGGEQTTVGFTGLVGPWGVAVDSAGAVYVADATAGRVLRLTPCHDDDQPPTLDLPAPITVDATGTTGGAVVSFTATASDENPVNPAVACTPASGSTFAIGTVTCSATDAAGNVGEGSFTVTVDDVLPPTLALPGPITVDARDPGGSQVTFSATATDDDPARPNPAVTCTPASGSTFVAGTTTVTCTATDPSGNTGQGTFTVHVSGAAELLADLVAESQGVGPGKAVSSKAEKAQSEYAAGKVDKTCKSLEHYVEEVWHHTPQKIGWATAAKLSLYAARIHHVIGC